MPNNIESRIVEMEFDNRQFERGAKETITTLDNLKSSLEFKNVGKGLDTLSGSITDLHKNFETVFDGFEEVGTQTMSKFQAFSLGVFEELGRKVTNLGLQIANELFVAQKKAGFAEYELELGSVQTIQASTGEQFDKIYGYLAELNTYADKTIYSFSDMTSNIGKFTNAGVQLDTAVKAIQGISNEAALSGANANEASRAMYNFAQALSSGAVKLIDWKSIENANMATVEFKQELLDTALALGTVVKKGDKYISTTTNAQGKVSDAFNATANFNDSLSAQWMTTEVLTETLARYSDETTDLGKRAFAAAQDVKSFTQLIDTLKEAIGSGWAESFRIIFGEFEDAKKLWTGVSNTLGGVIDSFSNLRNHALRYWKDEGGRTKLLNSLIRLWKIFSERVKIIGESFYASFPIMNRTGHVLMDLTTRFQKFTIGLKKGFLGNKESLENFRKSTDRVFHGVRALMHTVRDISSIFVSIFKVALESVNSELDNTRSISEIFESIALHIMHAAKALKTWATQSDRLKALSTIFRAFLAVGELIAEVFKQVYSAFRPVVKESANSEPTFLNLVAKIAELVIKLKDFVTESKIVERVISGIINVIKKFKPVLDGFKEGFGFIKDKQIVKGLKSIGDGFKKLFKSIFSSFKSSKDISKSVGKDASGTGKIITSVYSRISEAFKKFIDSIKSLANKFKSAITGLFKSTGKATEDAGKETERKATGLTWVAEKLLEGLSKIIDKLKPLGKLIKDSIAGIFTGFNFPRGAEEFISFINDLLNKIKDALHKISEGINLTEITSTIGEGLKGVWIGLTEDPLLTALVAGWLQLIDIAKTIVSPVKSVSKGIDDFVESASKSMDATTGFINSLKSSVDAWKKAKTAEMFTKIAAAMLLVAVSVALITYAFSKDGAAATVGLGSVVGLLLEMSSIVKSLGEATLDPTAISRASSGMLKMAAALFIMSLAVKGMAKAGKDNSSGLILSVLAMVLLMGTMSEVIKALVNETPGPKMLKSASSTMIKMSAALFIMSKAVTSIAKVGKDNTKSLILSILGMVLMMGAMVKMAIKLAEAATEIDKRGEAGAKTLTALVGLMGAIAVMAVKMAPAVKTLGEMDPADLTQGLLALSLMLAMVFKFTDMLSKQDINDKGLKASATVIGVLAAAMKGMGGIVSDFGKTDPDKLFAGLGAFTALAFILMIFMKEMTDSTKDLKPTKLTAAAQGLILIAVAMVIMSFAVKNLAGLSFEDIGPGVVILAGLLVLIFGAFLAVSKLGGAKDSVALAGSIILMSVAIAILAETLNQLQKIDFDKVKGGLLALGLLMAGLVVLGFFAAPLQELGLAFILFGAATFMAGKGIWRIGIGVNLLVKALTSLAVAWPLIKTMLSEFIETMATMMPTIAAKLVDAIKVFATKIIDAAPIIADAIKTIIKNIFDSLYGWIPDVAKQAIGIIKTLLSLISKNADQIFADLFNIIVVFLDKLEERMPELVDTLGNIIFDIIIGTITVLINRIPELAEVLYQYIITLINTLATMFDDEHVDAFIESASTLIDNFIDAIIKVFNASQDKIMEIGPRIVGGIVAGIKSRAARVAKAILRLFKGALGIAKNHFKEWKELGINLIKGIIKGIKKKAKELKTEIEKVGKDALKNLKKTLKIASPSKETFDIGMYLDEGLADGIRNYSDLATDATDDLADDVLGDFGDMEDGLSDLSDYTNFEGEMDISTVMDLDEVENAQDVLDGLSTPDMYAAVSSGFGDTSATMAQQTNETVNASFNDETKEMYESLKSAIKELSEMLDNVTIVSDEAVLNATMDVDGAALGEIVIPFVDAEFTSGSKKSKTKTAQKYVKFKNNKK